MDHPHILLVSLETLRRDHLRCYGYHKDLAPHIDRLAAGGVRFRDSVANCGWTLPQHMTLHTGLYPLTHGCLLMREQPPLADKHMLLAERLKEHGYRTFAGVSERNAYGGHARYGFDRGFDEHVEGAVYNRHMDWTEEFIVSRFREHHKEAPCFVYVHVNDTHEPFDAPEPWREMWGDSYHNRYEGDITYVDHHLGRVFAALRELGIFEETLVVIFADHGTEFSEHGFREKKVNLYNEILHVPLIFHCPSKLPAGEVVTGLVESAQVAPTILDMAGLSALPTAQGCSLLPRIMGKGPAGLGYVASHTRHEHQGQGGAVQFDHYAIQTLRHKFIRLHLHVDPDALHSDWKARMQAVMVRCRLDPGALEKGAVLRELYDLARDPEEGVNLIPRFPDAKGEHVETAKGLEAKLDEWIGITSGAEAGP